MRSYFASTAAAVSLLALAAMVGHVYVLRPAVAQTTLKPDFEDDIDAASPMPKQKSEPAISAPAVRPVTPSPALPAAPVTAASSPAQVEQQPAAITATPAAPAASPALTPVAEQPKPAIEAAKPVAQQPQPVVEAPKPVAQPPKPVAQPAVSPAAAQAKAAQRRVLDADDAPLAVDTKPHPIAASYPDHNVIVCVAGCYDNPTPIVFIEPRQALARGKPLLTLASSTGIASGNAASEGVQCMAGCYGDTARSSSGQRGGASSAGAHQGTWMTVTGQGVSSDSKAPSGQIRTMKGGRAKTQQIESGEWFTKRFQQQQ